MVCPRLHLIDAFFNIDKVRPWARYPLPTDHTARLPPRFSTRRCSRSSHSVLPHESVFNRQRAIRLRSSRNKVWTNMSAPQDTSSTPSCPPAYHNTRRPRMFGGSAFYEPSNADLQKNNNDALYLVDVGLVPSHCSVRQGPTSREVLGLQCLMSRPTHSAKSRGIM